MASTTSTIPAKDLAAVVDDPARGVISIIGDRGHRALITGEIYPSNVIPGCLTVETEHGSLYLDLEGQVRVAEDDGANLNARVDGSLYAVNGILTGHLADRFGWYARTENHYDALNDLSLATAEAIDDLLAQFPADEHTQEGTDEDA